MPSEIDVRRYPVKMGGIVFHLSRPQIEELRVALREPLFDDEHCKREEDALRLEPVLKRANLSFLRG